MQTSVEGSGQDFADCAQRYAKVKMSNYTESLRLEGVIVAQDNQWEPSDVSGLRQALRAKYGTEGQGG
ncbi:YhfG family protein [Pokkaliibacter plantistimulans]|uniref:YhfG family protein n=1 Tax=Pokkaliibacter plantistimulans TaxID=1635171 RepID=UPI003AEFAE01